METILIADDAKFMRNILRNILTKNGYKVIEAVNGVDATDKFKEYSPDLVILDIIMPLMDGLTVITFIKKIDPDAKIIICSSMGCSNIVIDAVTAGTIDFIVKPFNVDILLGAVKKALY